MIDAGIVAPEITVTERDLEFLLHDQLDELQRIIDDRRLAPDVEIWRQDTFHPDSIALRIRTRRPCITTLPKEPR